MNAGEESLCVLRTLDCYTNRQCLGFVPGFVLWVVLAELEDAAVVVELEGLK